MLRIVTESVLWGIGGMALGCAATFAIMLISRRSEAVCPRCAFKEKEHGFGHGHG